MSDKPLDIRTEIFSSRVHRSPPAAAHPHIPAIDYAIAIAYAIIPHSEAWIESAT